MDENMTKLFNSFKVIRNKGYITSFYEYRHSAGLTFERLLGKESDELFWPDYNGIEIKTKQEHSKSRISLFTAVPDGKFLYRIQYLYDKYGKEDNNSKKFNIELKANKLNFYNKRIFRIFVDRKNQWIVLKIYDYNKTLIDDSVVWSFDLIKERLNLKLQKLALVKCCTKRENNRDKYWYYKIIFYKDIIFDKFLEQLEKGNISIKFTISTFKFGKRAGQLHNHGTIFAIEAENLEDIYLNKYVV